MVGQVSVSSKCFSRMTSLELPPIKSLPKKDTKCLTKNRTTSFQQSALNRSLEFSDCFCNRHSLTSSSSGCSNQNPLSRCQKCSSEIKPSNPETNPRNMQQPETQRGIMRREMTWHSGAANKSLIHSNSTSSVVTNAAVASSPRLKPLRSNNTSARTSTSGEKLTMESGSSQTDSSIAKVNSYNSLSSLKDRLPGNRASRLSVPHSPGVGTNSAVVARRSLSQTRPGSSQVTGRRLYTADKNNNSRNIVNKSIISRNQRNEMDTNYARDTEQRIISWLIGVKDSEPEEPLAPFFEYVDLPPQTDTAVHIVYKGDWFYKWSYELGEKQLGGVWWKLKHQEKEKKNKNQQPETKRSHERSLELRQLESAMWSFILRFRQWHS